MNILTVDDSAIIRKIIRGAAEVLDYGLLEASDGFDALEIVRDNHGEIELILLDWNMPGMNGLEFLQKIKKVDEYKHIPVMMVTTETEKENIIQAIQAGAAHYMIKPFAMEELIKKIMECLGKGEQSWI